MGARWRDRANRTCSARSCSGKCRAGTPPRRGGACLFSPVTEPNRLVPGCPAGAPWRPGPRMGRQGAGCGVVPLWTARQPYRPCDGTAPRRSRVALRKLVLALVPRPRSSFHGVGDTCEPPGEGAREGSGHVPHRILTFKGNEASQTPLVACYSWGDGGDRRIGSGIDRQDVSCGVMVEVIGSAGKDRNERWIAVSLAGSSIAIGALVARATRPPSEISTAAILGWIAGLGALPTLVAFVVGVAAYLRNRAGARERKSLRIAVWRWPRSCASVHGRTRAAMCLGLSGGSGMGLLWLGSYGRRASDA